MCARAGHSTGLHLGHEGVGRHDAGVRHRDALTHTHTHSHSHSHSHTHAHAKTRTQPLLRRCYNYVAATLQPCCGCIAATLQPCCSRRPCFSSAPTARSNCNKVCSRIRDCSSLQRCTRKRGGGACLSPAPPAGRERERGSEREREYEGTRDLDMAGVFVDGKNNRARAYTHRAVVVDGQDDLLDDGDLTAPRGAGSRHTWHRSRSRIGRSPGPGHGSGSRSQTDGRSRITHGSRSQVTGAIFHRWRGRL